MEKMRLSRVFIKVLLIQPMTAVGSGWLIHLKGAHDGACKKVFLRNDYHRS
jgi:hypothetical protein